METHFDVIVVGSGFGGAVTAFRLAQAGRRVCVLERGQAYPPHSFPRAPHEMKRNFWDPSAGRYGMFNFWSFSGTGALVSSGLGGGSLIYANVLLRKDEGWFKDEDGEGDYTLWPVQYKDLESHYERVERMMNAQPYPFLDRTPKTQAMQQAAAAHGYEWQLPNLAVSFRRHPYDPATLDANPPVVGERIYDPDGNLHANAPRQTCQLCGECNLGCNYGSKNTLDFNYLSAARRHGADIRTLCEVRSFEKRDNGAFAVRYVVHDLAQWEGKPHDTKDLPETEVTADRLVLAAGTFGTSYLLLKNMPGLSKFVGRKYSGNGDLLTFFQKARRGKQARELAPSRGPVITSATRIPDTLDGGDGRGFYVEDGGFPGFVNWLIEAPGLMLGGLALVKAWLGSIWGGDPDLSAEIADALGPATTAQSLLPLLNMGRAPADGLMTLQDTAQGPRLACAWERSEEYFDRVLEVNEKLARSLGAELWNNPLDQWFDQVITAHPLGGCPMGTDAGNGVVDSYGAAFNCPGLYVADGSIFPGPVGPNPSLTIAALADRCAERMIENF